MNMHCILSAAALKECGEQSFTICGMQEETVPLRDSDFTSMGDTRHSALYFLVSSMQLFSDSNSVHLTSNLGSSPDFCPSGDHLDDNISRFVACASSML